MMKKEPEAWQLCITIASIIPMNVVGIDLHKRYMQVAVLDEDGNLIHEDRIHNDSNHYFLENFLDTLEPDSRIALESSSVWYSVYRYIEDAGFDVVLSNPLKTKLIAYSPIKTDKRDARILAELLRINCLPICYVPPPEVMEQRDLVRHRRYLVELRTSLKNKIHAVLLMNNLRTKHAGFTKQHRYELRQIGDYRINSYLDIIESVSKSIKEADKKISLIVENHISHNAKLLASIPGIGYYSALVIAAEIGDISRFPDSHHLCSYAGLVPSTYSSGGKTRHGGITRHGSSMLRSVLCECVLSHMRLRKNSNISEFRARIARKKGNPKANVAAASKLLRICFWLLKEQREYSETMERHHPRPALESRKAAVNTLVITTPS